MEEADVLARQGRIYQALAIYREGSKGAQPLANHCVVEEGRASCCE